MTDLAMHETAIERDERLQRHEDAREVFARLAQAEKWMAVHEAVCASRYAQIITSQRWILIGVVVAIGLAVPAAWPHLTGLLAAVP